VDKQRAHDHANFPTPEDLKASGRVCHAGNIVSVYLVDWLGRRLTACVCLAGACVSALAFAAAPPTGAWALVAACVFNGISVGGWNALDLISAELYPTSVRSAGVGLMGAAGRLASFLTTLVAGMGVW